MSGELANVQVWTLARDGRHTFMTLSGKRFDFDNPTIESVCIEDVAHALGMTCRYGGQIDRFYSVAQHSRLVAHEAGRRATLLGVDHSTVLRIMLMGLLHDAAEAYVGDVISPLKRMMQPQFGQIEGRVHDVVMLALGVVWLHEYNWLIDEVDKGMFARECIDLRGRDTEWARTALNVDLSVLMQSDPIVACWSATQSKREFISAYAWWMDQLESEPVSRTASCEE